MSAEFLPREAFADEQSYIAHRQHVAALQRAEKQHAGETAWQRAQREDYRRRKRLGLLTPTERLIERIKNRERMKRSYWSDPDVARFANRYHAHRWRSNNRERSREINRKSYWKHREERMLYQAGYYREHREEICAKERIRGRTRYMEGRVNYISRDDWTEKTRIFVQQLIVLRQQGYTWTQIEGLTGVKWGTCANAYGRYLKRQQQQDNHEQSA